MITEPKYRDLVGTLNINLKVLSARLDKVLESPDREQAMTNYISTAEIFALEMLAQNMAAFLG